MAHNYLNTTTAQKGDVIQIAYDKGNSKYQSVLAPSSISTLHPPYFR